MYKHLRARVGNNEMKKKAPCDPRETFPFSSNVQ